MEVYWYISCIFFRRVTPQLETEKQEVERKQPLFPIASSRNSMRE